MTSVLATLFLDPIPLSGLQRAALLLPICLSISVVYRTIKTPNLRDIPKTALALWVTIVVGMWLVALTLYVVYLLFA
ncbi:MAG: hypothetical protein O7D91_16545 [Planctomycetota bacterium]|nr:hypothetical protein [Planctomycetota bacterium]